MRQAAGVRQRPGPRQRYRAARRRHEACSASLRYHALAAAAPKLVRHRVLVGESDRGEVAIDPYAANIVVCGTSGTGKSTLTTGLLERLSERGYQYAIIDPESDYAAVDGAVALGAPNRPPLVADRQRLGQPARRRRRAPAAPAARTGSSSTRLTTSCRRAGRRPTGCRRGRTARSTSRCTPRACRARCCRRSTRCSPSASGPIARSASCAALPPPRRRRRRRHLAVPPPARRLLDVAAHAGQGRRPRGRGGEGGARRGDVPGGEPRRGPGGRREALHAPGRQAERHHRYRCPRRPARPRRRAEARPREPVRRSRRWGRARSRGEPASMSPERLLLSGGGKTTRL